MEEGTGTRAHIQRHLQKLILVETVEVVLPLAVFLQQQVVQADPDLAIEFCHLEMVLNGNRLPFAVDVLLHLASRESQIERRSVRFRFEPNQKLPELGQTFSVTHPRATVYKLNQHTGHVVGAQQPVDHTDAKRQNQQMNRQCE